MHLTFTCQCNVFAVIFCWSIRYDSSMSFAYRLACTLRGSQINLRLYLLYSLVGSSAPSKCGVWILRNSKYTANKQELYYYTVYISCCWNFVSMAYLRLTIHTCWLQFTALWECRGVFGWLKLTKNNNQCSVASSSFQGYVHFHYQHAVDELHMHHMAIIESDIIMIIIIM